MHSEQMEKWRSYVRALVGGIALVGLSFWLFSYFSMMALAFEAWPTWRWIALGFSTLIVLLLLAVSLDRLERRLPALKRERPQVRLPD